MGCASERPLGAYAGGGHALDLGQGRTSYCLARLMGSSTVASPWLAEQGKQSSKASQMEWGRQNPGEAWGYLHVPLPQMFGFGGGKETKTGLHCFSWKVEDTVAESPGESAGTHCWYWAERCRSGAALALLVPHDPHWLGVKGLGIASGYLRGQWWHLCECDPWSEV
jgi:hypothetical protein